MSKAAGARGCKGPIADTVVDATAALSASSGPNCAAAKLISDPNLVVSWLAIMALGGVDSVWAFHMGLRFSGWAVIVIGVGLLIAGALFYGLTGRSRALSDACLYTALWLSFSAAGSILTYLAAALEMPLQDRQFFRMDAALGFNWFAYHAFIVAHPLLKFVLFIAYASLLPQIVGSIFYFALSHRTDRNAELLWTAMLSLVFTTIVFAWLPALGPFPLHTDYYPDLIALHTGTTKHFVLGHMQGIITMPSYHAVLALLLIYAHRPPSRWFLPFLIFNLLMLFSIPEGHHYLVDIIVGVAIAVIAIALIRIMPRRSIDSF